MSQQISPLRCNRCGHRWWPRSAAVPKRCPACGSPYWDRPRKYAVQPERRARHRA